MWTKKGSWFVCNKHFSVSDVLRINLWWVSIHYKKRALRLVESRWVFIILLSVLHVWPQKGDYSTKCREHNTGEFRGQQSPKPDISEFSGFWRVLWPHESFYLLETLVGRRSAHWGALLLAGPFLPSGFIVCCGECNRPPKTLRWSWTFQEQSPHQTTRWW